MIVLVHREAVHEVDEGSTAFARPLHVPEGATLVELLQAARQYLPAIDGGKATWVCEGDRPLAVVTQEYREPWPLTGGSRPLAEVAGTLPRPHFFFRYHAQESPEDVYRRLGGDPVRLPKEAWEASREISWSEALRDFFTPRTSRRRT